MPTTTTDNEPDSEQETREARFRGEIDEIGRRVKASRSERGWSLRRLAEVAGVSASLLSAVENGRIVPSVSSLFAISDALDTPAEQFFPQRRRAPVPVKLPDPDAEATAAVPNPAIQNQNHETANAVTASLGSGSASESGRPAALAVPDTDGPEPPGPSSENAETAALGREPSASGATGLRSVGSPAPPGARRRGLRPRARRLAPVQAGSATSEVHGPEAGPRFGGEAPVGMGAATRDLTDRTGNGNGRSQPVPGVEVVRRADRPTMHLGNGPTWSLVGEMVSGAPTVIEVTIPARTTRPAAYRVHDHAVELVVGEGELLVEAAFSRTVLGIGDAATLRPGVPHRLSPIAGTAVRIVVVVPDTWDGTI